MKQLTCVLALSLSLLALSACQTYQGLKQDWQSMDFARLGTAASRAENQLVYTGDCPSVQAVEELQYLTDFTDPNNTDESNLISSVKIENLRSTCNFETNTVTVDLEMNFQGIIGPQGRAIQGSNAGFSYPFFAAVTSANGKILAKEVFTATLNYGPGQTSQVITEKLRQIIPFENAAKGSDYKVLVGLQLTPNQLAYNRQKIAEAKLLAQAEAQKPKQFEATPAAVQEQAQKEIYIGRPVDIMP